MSNLLQKASIITTPTAYDTGKILSVKPVQYYGPELVTNGDFATDSDWIKSTGWTISGGIATLDGTQVASSGLGSTTMSVTSGKTYKVVVNVISRSSGFRLYDNNGVVTYGLSVGENVFYRTATSSNYQVTPLGLSGATGSISNVSVKEALNADFDFTRNSSATRVGSNGLIQDVASNLPRIDYTGGVGSWKFEPQSTNLLRDSGFNDVKSSLISGYWFKNTNAFISENSAIGVDGLQSAATYTYNGGGTTEYVYASQINTASGVTYTLSGYVKLGTASNFVIVLNNTLSWNTIPNGNFVATAVDGYDNWKRFKITFVGPASNKVNIHLGYHTESGVATQAFGSVFIDSFQLESQSYPTSYIPTSGQIGGVTRLADAANNAGSSDLISSTEGVLYAEISALANDGTFRRISLTDGTNNNRILLGFGDDNNISAVLLSGGGLQSNLNSSIDILNNNKVAFLYKENNFELWINGFQISTDNSGITFSNNTLNVLDFKNSAGGFDFYGNTKSVAVFKEALTDLELECLVSWMSFSDLGINFGYTVE
jgi:hypothetical protein